MQKSLVAVLVALSLNTGVTLAQTVGSKGESVAQKDDTTVTTADIVNRLTGSGLTITNPTFSGDNVQVGVFDNFGFLLDPTGANDFSSGVIISTGSVEPVVATGGTNTLDNQTTSISAVSSTDVDLNETGFDHAKLTFTVVPTFDTLILDFVFGSEEYNEYVYAANDSLKIMVDGVNCALTPDNQDFSINAVNRATEYPPVGAPGGPYASSNPELYINNDPGLDSGETSTANFATQMDGFTKRVTCRAAVTPNQAVNVAVGVTDKVDETYDSWAFFRAKSLRAEPGGDLGDAPDSYQTLLSSSGPSHTIVEGVHIGTQPSGDIDGFADGFDDSNGLARDDTDDGIVTFPQLDDTDTSYAITANVTSFNGQPAYIGAWIDFDRNGSFEADEFTNQISDAGSFVNEASDEIASGTYEEDIVITWGAIPAGTIIGDSFARIRISNTPLTSGDFGGSFNSGEVEDYRFVISGAADVTVPDVTIDDPTFVSLADDTSYVISGTCTVGDGVVTVVVDDADGTPSGITSSPICSADGTWTATFDVSGIDNGIGQVIINASQTDKNSNQGSATQKAADKDSTSAITLNSLPKVTSQNEFAYAVNGSCLDANSPVTVSIAGLASQSAVCADNTWQATFDVSSIADGTGVIVADANDSSGSAVQQNADKDTSGPGLTLSVPPAANSTNQSSYSVTGMCESAGTDVTVYIPGASPERQRVACNAGVWTATTNVTAISAGNDVIEVFVDQDDLSGNSSAVDDTANKDIVAPNVVIDALAPAAISNQNNYPVTGTCTTGDGLVTVAIAGATPASQTVSCSGTGTWNATFDVSAIADGTDVISADASQTDTAGNTGNATQVKANKDIVAPTVVINALNDANASNSSAYPITGSCSIGDGNVTVFVAGATPADQSVTCTAAGTWTATFDVSAIADGNNAIIADAMQTDASGNSGSATQVTADKDVVAPNVVINALNDANATNSSAYGVTGTCTINDGDVTVSIVGATPSSQAVTCTAAGTWTATFNVSSIADGDNVVVANAMQTDNSGNTDSATQLTADKDTSVPVVTVDPLVEVNAANVATYPVSGTCSIGDGNVAVMLPGASPASQSVVCNPDGTWTATFDVSAIADGADSIVVNASQTDGSGNTTSTANQTSDKDSTLPVIAINTLVDGNIVNRTSYPVNGTCTIGDGNVTVNIVGATPSTQSVACNPDGTWSSTFDVSAIADGADVIVADASQTDSFGNVGNAVQESANKDEDQPIVSILNAPVTINNNDFFVLTFEFSEDVLNFDLSDIIFNNATLANFTVIDGNTYTVEVTPDGAGNVDIGLLLAAAQDSTGNDTNATAVEVIYDQDNDGISDEDEIALGLDPTSNDSDKDGIPDGTEVGDVNNPNDSDSDGMIDAIDPDDDNDGIATVNEDANLDADNNPATGITDSDGDGIPDYLDTDSDGDNISDANESVATGIDSDNDGIDDAIDVDETGGVDANGDGVDDNVAPANTDGDLAPDYIDVDSDGDGIPDYWESGALNVDSDMDGIDDAFDVDITGGSDINGDGIDDNATPPNNDADTSPDFQDLDSDNDGISDAIESGALGIDTDGDGIDDYFDVDQTGGVDANGDGIDDDVMPIDTDNDGIPDFQDPDSDNDGLPDVIETGATGIDTDGDGIDDAFDVNQTGGVDLDGDGMDDNTSPYALDSDGDGIADHLDNDSDNDGLNDGVEAGLSGNDTDGDGIDDSIDVDETGGTDTNSDGIDDDFIPVDTDSDGIPDYLDPDSDNDGLPDTLEGNNDTDMDGIPDYLDSDSDGDGIDDSVESGATGMDSDNDGIDDAFDVDETGGTDANNDGVDDNIALPDSDEDGRPDFQDSDVDTDGDGIPDVVEGNGDMDGDGIPNYLDLDSDGDGINDASEGAIDSDSDGIPDYLDLDSDGDGISDTLEGNSDNDGDGVPNYLDLDSDGDGISDADEGNVDSDGDGIPDYLDLDSDGDGISDADEGNGDADGDGIPDYLDQDSDGDGISDAEEGNGDSDGDGIPDYLDGDSDGDGINDADEGNGDTDGDGIPDYLDGDSDGDGISDADEGVGDSDGDGTPDYLDSSLDEDGDGIPDIVEGTGDDDMDGIPNYLDTDSDNDGIVDGFEAGNSGLDTDGDGIDDSFDVDQTGGQDANGDGIDDDIVPTDTDNDGIADYIDLDSDNDGVPDVVESQLNIVDTDGDGIEDQYDVDATGGVDTDGDGIDDAFDVDATGGFDADGDGIDDATLIFTDTDGDGLADYLDQDSDNDGISDSVESDISGQDVDMDGIDDAFDIDFTGGMDANNDGIDDSVNLTDTDGDGIIDMHDLDSDNDGLLDTQEAGVVDDNGDGFADDTSVLITDPIDTDGDGISDYRDLDSDNDGIFDIVGTPGAGLDINNDGMIDPTDDIDGDGIYDSYDANPGGRGTSPGIDPDGDGIPSHIDKDDDNDGISDVVEGVGDSDGDGIPDYLDVDSDNDGLPDSFETNRPLPTGMDSDADGIDDAFDVDVTGGIDSDGDGIDDVFTIIDTDNDGIPDYLDLDSDGDGINDSQEQVLIILSGVDSDNDGIDDAIDVDFTLGTDANGDGIDDNSLDLLDIDGDGVPNFRDIDSDGDGINDATEGNVDTDGDGIPDYKDIDSDGDGVSDSQENGDFNNDGINDSLQEPRQVESTLKGAGSSGLLILGGLFLMVALSRKRQFMALALLVSISVSGQAKENCQGLEDESCWYLSGGLGMSYLDPNENNTGWKTFDDKDTAFKLYGGYAFNEHWFAELSYTDLGEALLSNRNPNLQDTLKVDYSGVALQAGYWLKPVEAQWNAFIRAGISKIDSSSNLEQYHEQLNSTQFVIGAGIQWRFSDNWMTRLEVDSYDKDAFFLGLSISRFFGDSNARKSTAMTKPTPRPEVISEPIPVVAPVRNQDVDADGVLNKLDKCPDTSKGLVVNEQGCPVAQKVIIQFDNNSTVIGDKFKLQIDDIAAQLRLYKEVNITLEGHTDWRGKQTLNQPLSESRARVVAEALMQATNLPESAFTIMGHGELKPIDSNKTEIGRYNNRRVEVLIKGH
ncbi:choice-of-anchor L domain-containing protein [Colwellia sp. 6M3]|uniref:choice-of-anchor L domain-containing protein n=1 Tax=Colwellia sp. 6M3 TaxID=2759849 RepID=UPI0015F35FB5|nr:choice-of-anchor L domain-containing protein [Colwellia sp. 6M3]MBA6417410.1 choice-of-anchor L domain-containing protein [Colwellia sp. 6M3]